MDMDTVILVVDDNTANLALVQKILGREYRIAAANSGMAALKYLENHRPDLILMDIDMPQMSGFQVIEQLKENSEYSSIPVIFLTGDKSSETETLCFKKGAVDFVSKPFVPDVLLSRVGRILELESYSNNLEKMVALKSRQVERITLQAITAIANTIDAKDEYTKGHSVRVAEYSELIAKKLLWNTEDVQNLKYIALLHDIGKIGVPDSVLNKPGRLTEVEFELIKSHTVIGGEILKDIAMVAHLADGARYHHERYDGSGYPEGLAGEDIPIHARIIGIADAYDAMSSNRVYRSKMSDEKIFEELKNGRGTQFDPLLLDKFLFLLENGSILRQERENSEEKTLAEASQMLLERVINERKKLEKQNDEHDYLTQLLTRKAGEIKVIEAMAESSGCLALIDMDNLKVVNDEYGHLLGDYALKTVCGVLLELSKEAIAVRFGGDEFLYYTRCNTHEEAEHMVQGMIQAFQDRKVGDEVLEATSLSVGLCMYEKGDSYENIFQNADQALYYVKQTGKGGYHFHKEYVSGETNESSVDLRQLVLALKKQKGYTGTYHVKYKEFTHIYDFVAHLSGRYEYPIQMIMITAQLHGTGKDEDVEKQNILMDAMGHAISDSLRSVDITTRFSSAQHLVILVDASSDNVNMIINRIFQKFYKLYDGNGADITYDVAELEGNNGEAEG